MVCAGGVGHVAGSAHYAGRLLVTQLGPRLVTRELLAHVREGGDGEVAGVGRGRSNLVLRLRLSVCRSVRPGAALGASAKSKQRDIRACALHVRLLRLQDAVCLGERAEGGG